ncbi:GrpB family protein [Lysinibacillus sp. 2017]|uniref:GrpB family protein n=1 Tax=unclassified Lysinibacillus TaxID=2636778 RepID=UPI000D52A015|nr:MULTISPECIES: GrpB family protein [unclassified Lysinibacillus]AWE07675.1 GrpB family protein [Lysinibacillus sp. 2017]TGN36837.1 GrpB family protein [Lysinibacillus sp. S2017]
MRLGLKNGEVKLVPYEENWKDDFNIVKMALLEGTNLREFQIEHVGSTSIEGIQAKPIIDILVGVESLASLDKMFFSNLRKVGFYRLQVERPNEIVCAKFTDESFETKTHYIHIVELNKEKWRQMRFFRDYLNANEDVKQRYQALKNSFFRTDLNGINDYTEYKEPFVQSIFAKMEEI